MNRNPAPAFTAADMKVLRLLALALGAVTCVECLMAKDTTMLLLVIGLNVVTMVMCPLVIYLRRRAAGK